MRKHNLDLSPASNLETVTLGLTHTHQQTFDEGDVTTMCLSILDAFETITSPHLKSVTVGLAGFDYSSILITTDLDHVASRLRLLQLPACCEVVVVVSAAEEDIPMTFTIRIRPSESNIERPSEREFLTHWKDSEMFRLMYPFRQS